MLPAYACAHGSGAVALARLTGVPAKLQMSRMYDALIRPSKRAPSLQRFVNIEPLPLDGFISSCARHLTSYTHTAKRSPMFEKARFAVAGTLVVIAALFVLGCGS